MFFWYWWKNSQMIFKAKETERAFRSMLHIKRDSTTTVKPNNNKNHTNDDMKAKRIRLEVSCLYMAWQGKKSARRRRRRRKITEIIQPEISAWKGYVRGWWWKIFIILRCAVAEGQLTDDSIRFVFFRQFVFQLLSPHSVKLNWNARLLFSI